MRGRVVVNSDNIITYTDSYLTSRIGDICTRNGASVCILGDGTPADPELGLSMLATCRRLGHITSGDYWIVGPRGTIYVERVELSRIVDDNRELFVGILEYEIAGASPLALPAIGGMVAVDNLGAHPMTTAAMTGVLGLIQPDRPTISVTVEQWRANMVRLGCKPRSIDRFTRKVKTAASWCDWKYVSDVTLQSAEEWLSAMRSGDEGWSGPTHDQAVSILRCYGEFLRKRKFLPENPLEHLEASGEQGGAGSRALRTKEITALIAAAIDRRDDGRVRGNVPAFLAFLALTGLRYDEASKVLWGDLDLNGDPPALYTDPKRCKNGTRMRVVLNTEIQAVLKWHRTTVRCRPTDPVFPSVPNRHTWHRLREAAGIPAEDERGRSATYHGLRKWLATELDRAGASDGVVSRLLRHAGSLAQEKYIDPDFSAEVLAVSRLPLIWPENGKNIFEIGLEKDPRMPETMGAMADTPTQCDNPTPGRVADGLSSQASPGCLPGVGLSQRPGGDAGIYRAESRSHDRHGNGHDSAQVVWVTSVNEPVTTPSGRDNTRGNRVASISPPETGPAARESGAAFDQCGVEGHAIRRQRRTTDEERAEAVAAGIELCHWSSQDVVRSQDAAPHGTANLTGGGAVDPNTHGRGMNADAPTRNSTSGSRMLGHGLGVTAGETATFDPHRDADRYSAVAHNTKDSEVKKNLLTAAASLLMAAAAMAATFDGVISRGYSSGRDCGNGSGCYTQSSYTACLACCDSKCDTQTGWLTDCAKGCLGTPTQAMKRLSTATRSVYEGRVTADDLMVIEACQTYPDETVSTMARAIAGETPFVQQVQ